jgi:general transcription factor 3C polypeptide 3 (transcription factor C subunit 4)
MEQAVYCYRNAARLDKTNADVLWDYAFCLRETGQTQKVLISLDLPISYTHQAIKTYESILRILPHDLNILAQLRDLLVQTGALARAAELYAAAFEHHLASSTLPGLGPQNDIIIDPLLASTGDDAVREFGTREVATLADLLSGLGEHARAVDVVMKGARWLGQTPGAGGADEVLLGDGLDVNLRMRLAVAKLRLGELDIGKVSVDACSRCTLLLS